MLELRHLSRWESPVIVHSGLEKMASEGLGRLGVAAAAAGRAGQTGRPASDEAACTGKEGRPEGILLSMVAGRELADAMTVVVELLHVRPLIERRATKTG